MDNSGFDPRVAHTGIMVEQVALGRGLFKVDGHYPANMIPPMLGVHILSTHTVSAT